MAKKKYAFSADFSEKTVPVNNDRVLLYDSEQAGKTKWFSLVNLYSYLKIKLESVFTKKEETFIGAGCYTIPAYTDNLNGTITIGNFDVLLYDNANFIPPISKFSITGGLLNLTDQVTNYVVVNYNGGTPVLQVITNVSLINESTIIPIFSIFKDGNVLHLQDWDRLGLGLAQKAHIKDVKTLRYTLSLAGGLAISEFGTRNLNVTGATVYRGFTPVVLAAIDSTIDNIYYYKYSGGVWIKTNETQYNNTEYQDTNSIGTLTNNRYAINWLFRSIENKKVLFCVLGNGDYSENDALFSTVPVNLPQIITTNGYLIGRVIVQKNANTASYIQSAFEQLFPAGGVSSHNNLAGIDGGEVGYYGHLTEQELLNLQNSGYKDYGFVVDDPDIKKTYTFNPATGLFEITGDLSYYRQGKFNDIGITTKSITLPTNANAEYYIYFDNDTATLEYSTVAWNLNSTKVFVAIVVFRTGTPNKYIILYECHTSQFPRQVHRYLHSTQGTKLVSGGTISGITLNGTTDAQNTFGVAETVISDEDLRSTLNALADGTGAGTDYTVMYRNGSIFTWETDQPVPFKYTNAGYINYDNSGTLTQAANNKYINIFLLAINTESTAKERFICVTGQTEHATADAAYLETWATFNKIGFNFTEFDVLYQITYETNSGLTTKGKCRANRVFQVSANSVVSGTSLSTVDWSNITSIPTKLSDYYNSGNLSGVANIINISSSYFKGGILTEEVNKNKYEKILTNIAGTNDLIRNQTFYWNGSAYVADSSLFVGIEAGFQNIGASSTGYGYRAGYQNIGASCTFSGVNAGYQNIGASCTFNGAGSGLSNTGINCTFNGASSGYQNTGANCTFNGASSGSSNTGVNCTFSGLGSGSQNTGSNCTFNGNNSGYNNTGSSCTFNGYSSGYQNTGLSCVFSGVSSGYRNVGFYCNFNGLYSGYYNNWSNRIDIGYKSTTPFNENAATTKTFDNTAITLNTITINSHNFGTVGTKVNLIFKIVSGATPTGLVNNTVYQFTITSANVLTLTGINANGTGSYSLTKDVDISNTITFGNDVFPTKANQIIIGTTSHTETLLFGNQLRQINKYTYSAASNTADTIADIRTSNQSGVYKIEYCSAGNAVKGVGTWLERFNILENGNVGIGTTNPSEKLEVNGKIKATGGVSATYFAQTGFEGVRQITINNEITFTLNTYDFFKIDSNQNINTFRNKYNYLCQSLVNDNVGDIRTSNQSGVYKIEYCSVSNAVKGAGTWLERFNILENGNVGIGTTNPISDTVLSLKESTASGYALSLINRNSTANWQIYVDANTIDDGIIAFTYNKSINVLNLKTSGVINMPSLPTSASGLVTGDLWRDGSGYLRIV